MPLSQESARYNGHRISAIMSKLHPKANRNCTARWLPQTPSAPAPSRRELWAFATSHRFVLWEVPTVNPSGKNQRFLPAPFNKGAFGCAADTGRVREVTILDRLGKRLAGFHTGLYFEKVPTVNPSVTATPCQLPLTREPLVLERAHCVWQWALRLIPLQRPDWCGG